MTSLREIKDSILHIVFPHTCAGCGSDSVNTESQLCIRCMAGLPVTGFFEHPGNPVEKLFRGRLQIESGAAQYHFTKESLMQRLMHQFKYRGNQELGRQLGRMMGLSMKNSGRFHSIDAMIPLPLFPSKEKKRGFNQSLILCEGIAEIIPVPLITKAVTRPHFTETQTSKGRIERWKNIEGKFTLADSSYIIKKHILLVDDVITTGATLEACGSEILKPGQIKLSVAALCIASH